MEKLRTLAWRFDEAKGIRLKPPVEVSRRLDDAVLAMASGDLRAVETICRGVLVAHPDTAQALVMLGIVAQRTGRQDQAIVHLSRAVELNPGSFDGASCLAAAYRLSARLEEAVPFAELAVRLRPTHPVALMELGMLYLQTMRLQEAEKPIRQAVVLTGGGVHEQLALCRCLDQQGRPQEALQVVLGLLKSHPIPTHELLQFSPILLSQLNPTAAIEFSREASKRHPQSLRARTQLVRSLLEADRTEEAAEALDDGVLAECLSKDETDSESLTIIGMAYQSFGKAEKAREWFTLALRAPNPSGLAFYGYTFSRRTTEDDRPFVRDMESRLDSNPMDLQSLEFAIGKSYEDLGEYGNAMAHYDAGNRTCAAGPNGADQALAFSDREEFVATLSREFLEANRGFGIPTDLPILVVGMMRSGTTLVEQILASHPVVAGAGEVPFWSYNVSDVFTPGAAEIHPERLTDAARRYVELLSSKHPGKHRVVDKLPFNYKYLGIVNCAMPNVRVIHMRRNPADTCLSIYSSHSRAVQTSGNSRGDLVRFYRRYQLAMEHWREVLPRDRLLDVDYEELVGRPEPMIRRILEFCGLEWSESCLHPEQNPRAVSTISLWQVRRPINSASVDRWRRFEPWLGEFKELL